VARIHDGRLTGRPREKGVIVNHDARNPLSYRVPQRARLKRGDCCAWPAADPFVRPRHFVPCAMAHFECVGTRGIAPAIDPAPTYRAYQKLAGSANLSTCCAPHTSVI